MEDAAPGDEIKSGAGALQRQTKSLWQTYLLYMTMKFPPCACHKSGALRTRKVPASSCTLGGDIGGRHDGCGLIQTTELAPDIEDITGIRVRGDALKENGRVIDLTLAQRWSGHPPQTILGRSGSGAVFQCGRKHGLSGAAGAAFALRLCCALVENASCCTATNKTKLNQ
jgi:hypothetical protein